MKKVTSIKEIKELKRGNSPKNGKEWVLYKVVDNDNKDYTTFDIFGVKFGDEVEINYNEVKNGNFTNRRVVKMVKANAPSDNKDTVGGKFESLEARLKAVEDRLSNLEAENMRPEEIPY